MLRDIDEFKSWLENAKLFTEKYIVEAKQKGEHGYAIEEIENQTELADFVLYLINKLEKKRKYGYCDDIDRTPEELEEAIQYYDKYFAANWIGQKINGGKSNDNKGEGKENC